MQSGNSIPYSKRLILTSVHKLQHLHSKLHVTQAAATKLHIQIALRSRNKRLHTLMHMLAVSYKMLTTRSLPNKRLDHIAISFSKIRIPCCRARLQKCLKLPATRPLFIIFHMRIKPTNKRTILTFRAKRSINLPKWRLHRAHNHRLAYFLQNHRHRSTNTQSSILVLLVA